MASSEILAQICGLATAFGVGSLRAQLFALRAARAAAALRGAEAVAEQDLACAARLVLTPRATRMPQAEPPPPPPETEDEQQQDQTSEGEEPQPLEDRVDDAAEAALPADLLAALLASAGPRRIARGAGTSGATASLKRGRPVGARRGALAGDGRLAVLDTIRAAAPWQRLRGAAPGRIAVRAEDFHIKRFKEQPRRVAIFAVDASGSSAINRLAEAKGAIQLLLAECYVRRDEVALIAFRGTAAELLLPPTGALARVRRALAALPGGGPTPLAAGITAALKLADAERRRHNQPLLVLLTDGGANIGADGKPGRAAAAADALAAARALRAQNIPALIVDTAPRRNAFVGQLAAAMGGRYLALPYANAAALSRAVQNFGVSHDRLAA
jgi:magnesium chelatase subunit D